MANKRFKGDFDRRKLKGINSDAAKQAFEDIRNDREEAAGVWIDTGGWGDKQAHCVLTESILEEL